MSSDAFSINPFVIILSAFAFVGGLAWNDVVQTAITQYIPSEGNKLRAKIIYAIAITVTIIAAAFVLKYINTKVSKFYQTI